jgi:hypothetical protein
MTNSLRTVTKLSAPGSSKELDYVVNIYHNGKFKFAYRYRDWTEEAVLDEVRLLSIRFSNSNGFILKW